MATRLKELARALKRELAVYRRVARDPRTGWVPKALLGIAIAYVCLPFDLIPDFIPVLGHIDDVIIVPGLVWLALRMIPREVVDDARRNVDEPPSEG